MANALFYGSFAIRFDDTGEVQFALSEHSLSISDKDTWHDAGFTIADVGYNGDTAIYRVVEIINQKFTSP